MSDVSVVAQAQQVLRQQADAFVHCAARLAAQPAAYENAVRILYDTLQGMPGSACSTPPSLSSASSVSEEDALSPRFATTTATAVPPSWPWPHPAKIVVTGVGKSGHVARKVCATLQSTGSLAVFLHPTEALHGDLGVLAPGDALLMFTHSGRTEELVRLVTVLRQQQRACRVVAVCGDPTSPLGQLADAWVDAHVAAESDPALPAPTASTTLALAMGDCLALSLARMRCITARDFAVNHPGGNLGRVLGEAHQESAVVVSHQQVETKDEACKQTTVDNPSDIPTVHKPSALRLYLPRRRRRRPLARARLVRQLTRVRRLYDEGL